MIRGIVGLPRSGKSYHAIKFIIKELLSSKRWIVTTLQEIEIGKLQAYLARKYPEAAIDLSTRLQIIPKKEARRWYRYRGSYTLPEFEHDPKGGELPEALDARLEQYFAEVNKRSEDRGVCYFIDEAHRVFCAEEYAKFAKICMFYLTQHGHLDDMFWWCTQFPEQIVVQLRRLTQDTHMLRNLAFESFLKIFAKPKRFRWSLYYRCPESREKGVEPEDSGTTALDLEIAACYKTRGALGEGSPLAETPPKRWKLPFWAIFPIVGVVALGAILTLRAAPGLVAKGLRSVTDVQLGPDKPLPGRKEDKGVVTTPEPEQNASKPAETAQAVPRRVEWLLTSGARIRAGLDDGSVVTESDVRWVTDTHLVLTSGETVSRLYRKAAEKRTPLAEKERPRREARSAPAGLPSLVRGADK